MELKNLLLERSLRFNMKDVSIEDLIKIRDHFNKIITERNNEIEAKKEEEQEKQDKIAEAKKLLGDLGLELNDLVDTQSNAVIRKSTKGIKLPNKYKYPDPDNNEITLYWTGQDKTPNKLKKVVEKSHRGLDHCKI